jgi:hypothetical protein
LNIAKYLTYKSLRIKEKSQTFQNGKYNRLGVLQDNLDDVLLQAKLL